MLEHLGKMCSKVHLHGVCHTPWYANADGPMDELAHAGCVLHNGCGRACAAVHVQQNGWCELHVTLGSPCQGVNIYTMDIGTDSGRHVQCTKPPSKQMPPRLEAVFHNDRKDLYQRLRWIIPDRQACAEELRSATSFMRRECMPAIFWPVNPFPHKVDEYEIIDCLWEALGSISINHAYDLACETISKAAQQRWTEEMHYRQLNKVEPPPKPHKYIHTTDIWSIRHQDLVDKKKKRDAEWKVPTQPRSPKGRGGSLQFQ